MMTPDESRQLTQFLSQLKLAGTVVKDPQAAAMIADAVAVQPDAAYLLVQRSLLQDQALASASEKIARLESQVGASQMSSGSSFLNSGNNAWGRAGAVTSAATTGVGMVPTPMQPPAGAFQPAPAQSGGLFGGGGGSFLGTMAATAAGVAGGAFLFQGIENMMGHHGNTSHLADSANPFGGMADSVDHVGSGVQPAPAALEQDVPEQVADADLQDDGGASSGGDDSLA